MSIFLYTVTNWSATYENNRSRLVQNLNWVPVPNNHDGEAYGRLISRKDAAVVFASWILILQVASRCNPRGTLIRSNGDPHDSASLAFRTRAPAKWFDDSIPTLIDLGWLDAKPLPEKELALCYVEGAPQTSGRCVSSVNEQNRTEGKRREQKGAADAAGVEIPLCLQTPEFTEAWANWLQHRTEIKFPLKPTGAKAALTELAKMGSDRAVAAIKHTIFKGWRGLREPEGADTKQFPVRAVKGQRITEPPNWRARLESAYGTENVFLRDDRPWVNRSEQTQREIIKILEEIP